MAGYLFYGGAFCVCLSDNKFQVKDGLLEKYIYRHFDYLILYAMFNTFFLQQLTWDP